MNQIMNNIFLPIKYLARHKKIVFGVLCILGIGIFLFLKFSPSKQKTQYNTAQVERGSLTASITASGTILNANIVTVVTQASGSVSIVHVKDGATVKKGDVIFEVSLDEQGQQRNTQAWSSYLSAKNALESASTTSYTLQSDMFSKWKAFFSLATNSTYQNSDGSPNESNRALAEFHIAQKDWFASEEKYKNQKNIISQAQAALNSAWISYQLSSPKVTAPMDGEINNIVVVPGLNINTSQSTSTNTVLSQQLAVIQNNSAPLGSFNLSEIDIAKVKVGQKTIITLDSLQNKTFTGTVMTVDKIGSVSSGVTNYPIIIQFDNKVSEILPNMAANAVIIVERKEDVLSVPTSCLQGSGEETVARVLKNGVETQVSVQTGISSNTQTEILSGLNENDTVITGTSTTSQSSQGTSSSPFGAFGGSRTSGTMIRPH